MAIPHEEFVDRMQALFALLKSNPLYKKHLETAQILLKDNIYLKNSLAEQQATKQGDEK